LLWLILDFVLCAWYFDVFGEGPHHGYDDKVQRSKYKVRLSKEMILAKVLGNVVAIKKITATKGARVMLCEQITPEGDPGGNTILALDSVDAGVGDTVLIVQEGWALRLRRPEKAGAAIDSAIVGVVDRIDLLKGNS
jgi:ethanolamine utilization protein EutN